MNEPNDPQSYPDIQLKLSRLPHRVAPPQLMNALKESYLRPTFKERLTLWFSFPFLWKPVGAVAVGAILFGFWFAKTQPDGDYVDLEPLMAAHSRYEAETLVPQADIAGSDFSAQLASYYSNEH